MNISARTGVICKIVSGMVRIIVNDDLIAIPIPAIHVTEVVRCNSEVEAVEPPHDLPKLPVARVLWKPYPDMKTGCAAWILAGGAHHTGYSQNLTAEHMEAFADMAGIEYVRIGKNTDLYNLKNELRWNDVYYQISR